MSQLPAEVQTALGQLLAALSSSDNNVRSQAEEHLTNDWVVNRPDVLLMGLVEQMHGSQDISVCGIRRVSRGAADLLQARSFAAVLFRKQASKSRKNPVTNESKDLFFSLSNDAKVAIRQQILQCLATEQVSHVRNKIGDAIAEIARQYTDNGTFQRVVSHPIGIEADYDKTRAGPSCWPPSSRLVNHPIPACANVLSGYSQLRLA